MKLSSNQNLLSADIQACIDTPPITTVKAGDEEKKARKIINIKMRLKPASAMAETYELNISAFKHFQPEEFHVLMRNLKIAIDGTRTTIVSGQINFYVKFYVERIYGSLTN